MTKRSIYALAVAVGAAGCGGKKQTDDRHDAAAPIAVATAVDAAVSAPAAPDAGAGPVAKSVVPCVEEQAHGDEAGATDTLTLKKVKYTDLPGWADDHHAAAVPPFLASCGRLAGLADGDRIGVDPYSGRARDWRAACAAAARLPAGDDAAARAFFEAEMAPYQASGKAGPDGKMTGYCVQPLRGSRTKHGVYQHAIYARPPELVSVDLSLFIPDARARRIWGRVGDGAVTPFPTRAEIRRGALAGRGLELVWLDDPIDALFAQIEGSGKVALDDGSTAWIEFAGKNGRVYRGVAAVLRSMGQLPPGTGTMQGIHAWFDAHPDRTDEVLDQLPSVVFFKLSPQPGAVGSQGVILTAERSVAVDRSMVAASTPLWIDTRAPIPGAQGSREWRHLAIAQDTGGGIRGAVRADIYWGDDVDAVDRSGRMGGRGRYWLLLPRGLAVR